MSAYTALLLIACFVNIRSMGVFSAKIREMRGIEAGSQIPRSLWWLLSIAFAFVVFQGIVGLPKVLYSVTYFFPIVLMTITICTLYAAFQTMHSDTYLLMSLAPKQLRHSNSLAEAEAYMIAETYREHVMSMHCRYSFVIAGLTIVNMISMLWFQVF